MILSRVAPATDRAAAALVALVLAAAMPGAAPAAAAQVAPTPASQTGRVVGRVLDAATGTGLSGVGVVVVGTRIGATSGIDGRFTISGIPAGAVAIQARRIGLQAKVITGIVVVAGRAVEQNLTLAAATVQLQAVNVVSAAAERGSVNAALDAQRTSSNIVNAVTSEQIARSPDGDAAQAVQRVSGVTVQDGRYVFVRGLGERYTTASLNGARLPSPEPERKVVPLDLFPAGLLQTITTAKTFTPDLPGDFSGAQVDIRTREFPAQRQVALSFSPGATSGAVGRSLNYAPGVGGEVFALSGSARELPAGFRAVGNFQTAPVSQGQQNALINSLRDVWQADRRSGLPNGSFGASVGGNDAVFGHRLGYLGSLTYSYAQDYVRDQVRALARPGDAPGETIEYDRFTGSTGRNSVLWGGLLNLGTQVGQRTRLSLNNSYNRTADNDARVEVGSVERYGTAVDVTRLDYVQRSIYASQLAGEHDLGAHRVTWAATASGVTRDQPDRSELVYQRDVDPATNQLRRLWFTSGEGAVRTFATLAEHNYEGRLDYQFRFGPADRARSVKVGALGRATNRDANTLAYAISSVRLSTADRALPPEQLFSGRFTGPDSSVLQINPLGQGGQYQAKDRVGAGYAMADLGLAERVRVIGGARVERSQTTVDAVSTLGAPDRTRPTYTDLLPSLALTYKVSERQNLRLSGSRTLARPEYRELAPITTRDVIGGVLLRGNAQLVRTRIDNADVRWEVFPNAGEVLSLGVFYKHFRDPIERVYQATSNGDLITYANAESANDYGAEAEVRKSLGAFAAALAPFSAFANATVVKSEVRLGGSQAASTDANRRLVGQAPYVINTGLTYATADAATSATLLYNRVGERIVSAGSNPLPNVLEHPRNVLDFSVRFPLVRALSGRFDAKNLLDARYRVTQGSVTRESYYVGRAFSFGFTYQPSGGGALNENAQPPRGSEAGRGPGTGGAAAAGAPAGGAPPAGAGSPP